MLRTTMWRTAGSGRVKAARRRGRRSTASLGNMTNRGYRRRWDIVSAWKGEASMRIVSVNVGLPRPALWHGREVMTGIFKEPVAGRVAVRTLNLDGDRQADLTVHGGVHKAVYAYPSEHYQIGRAH